MNYNNLIYNIKIKNFESSNCFLNVYYYSKYAKTFYDLNVAEEIFLTDKMSQKFIFDKNFDYMKFLYPNVEINDDLNVDIKNLNQVYFEITIFFNNKNYSNNIYKIASEKNKNFIIKKKNWENICNEAATVCGITFGVSKISYDDANFEISVTHESENSKLIWFLVIGFAAILFFIIIGILVWIIKKRKNEQFLNKVESTSFIDDAKLG